MLVSGARNIVKANVVPPPASDANGVAETWAVGIALTQDGKSYGANFVSATTPFDLGGTVQTDIGGNIGF